VFAGDDLDLRIAERLEVAPQPHLLGQDVAGGEEQDLPRASFLSW
jgi:hypothetical protein